MGWSLYQNVEGGGEAGRDYAQDVRYIAIEHMGVRRDCFRLVFALKIRRGARLLQDAIDLTPDEPYLLSVQRL